MKKVFIIFGIILILVLNIVLANGEHEFAKAEELIKSKTPCEQLTEEQLEIIGDYYMEQMRPGEEHEVMDKIMGGEGSESLKEMHINMAKSFYCGEHSMMGSEVMNIMMGRTNIGMMGYGMMNLKGGNKMGYGMMTGATFGWGLLKLIYFVLAVFVASAIFWLTHNWLAQYEKPKKKKR